MCADALSVQPGQRSPGVPLPSMNRAQDHRIDSQLPQDVMAEVKWEPAAHAAQIGVEGVDVNLIYTAHSRAEHDLFTCSARRSAGVRNVVETLNLIY